MQANSSNPYRPHNPGHDYYEPGAYLITLVLTDRSHSNCAPISSSTPPNNRLSALISSSTPTNGGSTSIHGGSTPTNGGSTSIHGGSTITNGFTPNNRLSALCKDPRHPSVSLFPTGAIVAEEWEKTAAIQCAKGRKIRTLAQVCMPDHWHGVIAVDERMDKSLGYIIQCFKSSCTARWRREITGYVEPTSSSDQIRSMSMNRRRTYYASRPRIERPLFDDDYDDTICIDAEHLKRMIAYVNDNPRRAVMRSLYPQFMQRCLHVMIDGVDYAAFGNLFLLRWAKKVQVFCHRKARMHHLTDEERQQYGYTYAASPDLTTSVPYESTTAYQREHDSWVNQILNGATVIVTPGISKGEQLMKQECIDKGYPLIHLQKDPIGQYWKPEQSRFDSCINGSLLILAPWSLDEMGSVDAHHPTTDYSRFHNLNTLAEEICHFDGEARIVSM